MPGTTRAMQPFGFFKIAVSFHSGDVAAVTEMTTFSCQTPPTSARGARGVSPDGQLEEGVDERAQQMRTHARREVLAERVRRPRVHVGRLESSSCTAWTPPAGLP